MDTNDLRDYHKHITDIYDERSPNHDNSKWHRKTALKLVDDMPPNSGDCVLDLGTGTGTIAFHAASLVGPKGKVMGVDLSKGMLDQANKKLSDSKLCNLEFFLADAEHLKFHSKTFDRIYCASAFFCIHEPLDTLRHWHSLLKHDGVLCFHALPETSYVWVSVAREVLANYGFQYLLNTPTGTIDKSRQLLIKAGFEDINILEEKTGYYIPLDDAKKPGFKRMNLHQGSTLIHLIRYRLIYWLSVKMITLQESKNLIPKTVCGMTLVCTISTHQKIKRGSLSVTPHNPS